MSEKTPNARGRVESPIGSITSLGRTLSSVMEAGREILARRRPTSSVSPESGEGLAVLCQELLQHHGEASGLVLASEISAAYRQLSAPDRLVLFNSLATAFDVDSGEILSAAKRYQENVGPDTLADISRAVEAPRQKLFRRINMAPDGTATLVMMRGHLLPLLRENPQLKSVDSDLKHLFISWFNKGFLELRKIDWSSPALVLERIIAYEAVHEINGWDDLRSRLHEDRRCFAFFHPALENDPLVFVEIALTDEMPDAMAPLLRQERDSEMGSNVNTVCFYSISNCHSGLAGISFGNFLIKNVVEELKKEIPALDTFVTLSPVPGFRPWLLEADLRGLVSEELLDKVREPVGTVVETEVHDALQKLCVHYLVSVKSGAMPRDPVARFHLGNGALLHRVCASADRSAKRMEQSAGIMVNYLYDLGKIEECHEAYFDEGRVTASRAVSRMLK